MTAIAGQVRDHTPPAWLTQGFRPFFLAASLWGAAAIALWIAQLTGHLTLASRFDPLSWHIHEMLFGFVMAAVAGFLLTAIPNWTGRAPVQGIPLAALVGLWLLGRIVCLVSGALPAWLAVAADLAFPAALIFVVGHEIIGGRHWRNLPMLAPATVLGGADLLMHLEADGVLPASGLGWRLGIAAVLVFMSVIGGRIIPTFTHSWLVKRGDQREPIKPNWVDRCALGGLHAGLFGWALFPNARAVGMLLLAGAAFNLWRLLRWRGAKARSELLLAILHVGYAWLVLGAALLGVSVLNPAFPLSASIHALTTGAMGTMIVAVMTRASRGHTGRSLRADRTTTTIYAFVALAAATRMAAGFGGALTTSWLIAAAACWILAFALFAFSYGPMLLTVRRAN